MSFDPSLVAKGLAARLADIEATMDRHASFAFRPDEASPLQAPDAGNASALARDLVLRVLSVISDPVNGALLHRLAQGDAALAELAEVVALPRPAVWERVNDLVQVGVARHALDGDRAGLTGAGGALVELVEELVARTAEQARS